MPMHKIQTIEYECNRCGYKWIERRNGQERRKEEGLPSYCRKCKSYLWNTERTKNTAITARKWHDR
jgi:DNA-directed RNA polymerase subunit M/transcription elongation factor TFIIS